MNNRIKCDPKIFDKKYTLQVGPNLVLKPIFEEMIDAEAEFYLRNSKNELVKKYIPFAYVENIEQSKDKLLEYIKDTIMLQTSLLYCIRITDGQIPMIPIGYVSMESPLSPNGLEEWSINFWLSETMTGKNIMVASVNTCLGFLKDFSVSKVKAIVDKENIKSRNLLNKLNFKIEHVVSDKIIYNLNL